MVAELPRLLIGGVGSGCGKTTVTSAILQAFCNRNFIPAAFKCGPDYIDPMFHTRVIGAACRNLDLFLCDESTVRSLLAHNSQNAPLALIEGVMGFYDGVGGSSDWASAADLANKTDTPAVLVLSVKGKSLSLAAELQGFLSFRENTIAGVILNCVSKAMYPFYRDIIEEHTGLHVYGHLPTEKRAAIESRHLGLVTADEISDLQERLNVLADLAEECIDLDGLIRLAHTAPPFYYEALLRELACTAPVRIAVAQDSAFCFYYQDSLELLEELGAELVPFSPLEDRALPAGISGVYIGGGYPELYAGRLSENDSIRADLRRQITNGLPTLAECGGFMYLHEALDDASGCAFPMVGVIKGVARLQKRLQNFGYVTLTAMQDNLLCRAGDQIRAHEFHYSVSDDNGCAFVAQKPMRAKSWPCIHASASMCAGYPHFHFYANPEFAASFIRRCDAYRKERTT
ncbi:cobyrinate a,c-diamide synthase [Intestinibacillus massiliensis]|uniref:cobyrinate a,c-diamide synthase n=1 Tax=Intestinibacillus massiliensis TaxID=1871029 RepID=UPI000B35060A|nr:cobyrinate a,c-diamide synthase [Intestinibacillus massiliensis]